MSSSITLQARRSSPTRVTTRTGSGRRSVDKKKRAVGFKLSDGMEVPEELASRFKFARQKSKLAGTIRGSFFVIKGEY